MEDACLQFQPGDKSASLMSAAALQHNAGSALGVRHHTMLLRSCISVVEVSSSTAESVQMHAQYVHMDHGAQSCAEIPRGDVLLLCSCNNLKASAVVLLPGHLWCYVPHQGLARRGFWKLSMCTGLDLSSNPVQVLA